ncbi:MAG TPA: CopD family protein [Steroidobacteraceae bacterium]|nr:CopD family protein [Steroidobacteraceae bacterium]
MVAVALLTARPADAHAVLLDQSPDADVSLPVAPPEVRLRFNEVVTPVSLRVLDAQGRLVSDSRAISQIDTTVHLRLPTGLPTGTYVVTYRVISADAHPVGGSFGFAIGATTPDLAAAARIAGAAESGRWSVVMTALRFVYYIGLLTAAGTALFSVLVDRHSPVLTFDRRMMLTGCAVAAVALLASLFVEGADAAAATASHLADPRLLRIGLHTTLGTSSVVALGGLLLLTFGSRLRGHASDALLIAGAAVSAISFALTGHLVTAGSRWWSAPVIVLHVLSAAFWVGGLPPLIRRLSAEPLVAARIVSRFSSLALGSVAVLLPAGLVMSFVQVRAVPALVDTAYGRSLSIKMLLVAGMLALAAVNRRWLRPALLREVSWAAPRLRGTIRAELVIAASIILITATLGGLVPPRALAEQASAARRTAGASAPLTRMVMSGRQMAVLEVRPAHPGQNQIAIRLTNADGTAMDAKEVSAWISSAPLGIEARQHPATRRGPGDYSVMASLPIDGIWTVEIDALVSDFKQLTFTTQVPIQ